jgi:hypothetical protein
MFSIDEHVEVEATWGIYQRMIAAYRHPEPAAGRELMVKLIESLSAGVPFLGGGPKDTTETGNRWS